MKGVDATAVYAAHAALVLVAIGTALVVSYFILARINDWLQGASWL